MAFDPSRCESSAPVGDAEPTAPGLGLQVVVVLLVALGIFFRFINLDRKVYWVDETFTSLWMSGYTNSDVMRELSDGRPVAPEELQKYQRVDTTKTALDTIHYLATANPHQAPLYGVLARGWANWRGGSVHNMRTLPALISVGALLAMPWLCRELFGSRRTAWIAAGLMAVSPIHVLYAQDARPYSLWSLLILICSAALVRAMRVDTRGAWALYAVTLALALCAQLLSLWVALAHAVYVVVVADADTTSSFRRAASWALLAISPWLINLGWNLKVAHAQLTWVETHAGWFSWTAGAPLHFGLTFLDLPMSRLSQVLSLPILAMIGYAVWNLSCEATRRPCVFIWSLVGVPLLALALPDVLLGGWRVNVPRYAFPEYIAAQLAVAHLLARKTSPAKVDPQRRWRWQAATGVLVACGIVSCTCIAAADSWWTKYISADNWETARVINRAERPLVVVPLARLNLDILSLSAALEPAVRLVFVPESGSLRIAEGFGDVFLFGPSDPPRRTIESTQRYSIHPVEGCSRLWRLARR